MLTDSEILLIPELIRTKVVDLVGVARRVKAAELKVSLLEEELRRERRAKYGPASEKLNDAQLELLEGEPGVCAAEVEAEAAQPEERKEMVTRTVRRRTPRGSASLPAHLPRIEKLISCDPKDCICPCCQGTREVIGHEQTERLHRIPARYEVHVFKMEKRACRRCAQGGVTTATRPAFIISKGIATNEMVVEVMDAKYLMHLPLYRQRIEMERESGVLLSDSTLCGWMMECGFLLQAISRELMRDLVAGTYIQADETPIGVRSSEIKGRNHRGYLWEYGRPGGPVVFDYQDGRGRDGPARMLKGFRGKLQTDAYAVYGTLDLPGMLHAGCMAHVRRKFKEAADIHQSEHGLLEVLGGIGELYAIEKQAGEEQLTHDRRQHLRHKESRPRLAALKQKVIALRQGALPKGLIARACDYTLGIWDRLEVYLEDGQIQIDNNAAERSIRPVALGRKNWLHFGSKEAGPRIAAILSVMETCRRCAVPVREYLLDVLPRLASGKATDVTSLTPQAWAASRTQAAAQAQAH